jgi:cytochrome bd ubiquinol oxidase subunit I
VKNPASFSLFTIGDEANLEDVFHPPAVLLSVLAYNQPTGEVKGIRNLQAEYEQQYGPGYYAPSIITMYWTFRFMVGAGFLMMLLAARAVSDLRGRPISQSPVVQFLPFAIILPYLANSTGWIFTEMGRQPWVVFRGDEDGRCLLHQPDPGMVLTTLIGFALVYGLLMAARSS